MRALRIVLLLTLATGTLAPSGLASSEVRDGARHRDLSAGGRKPDPISEEGRSRRSLAASVVHEGGALVEQIPAAQLRTPLRRPLASLPRRVDLTDRMPPIGNQGNSQSCGGWSSGYYYKTAQELVEHGWSLYTPDNHLDLTHVFSPNYLYNQVQQGCDGTRLSDIFEAAVDSGVAPWASFPFNTAAQDDQTNCRKQPDAAAKAAAQPYRAQGHGYFWSSTLPANNDIAPLKEWLAYGDPFVILTPIVAEFDRATCQPIPPLNSYVTPRGNHFVAVIGYDDDYAGGAFKFINSWGTGWGCNGFGWMSYEFMRRGVPVAGIMYDYIGAGDPGGGGSAPPGSASVSGTVREAGQPAANVVLRLRRYDGERWLTVASATTGLDGRYTFRDLPALSAGQEYYVRYGPNNADEKRVFNWYAPSITALAAGQSVAAVDFDIADVELGGPQGLVGPGFPITFSWSKRPATPQDHFYFSLFDPFDARTEVLATDDLGTVSSYALARLPEGASYGIGYGWDLAIENASGVGQSFYYVPVTFKGENVGAGEAVVVPIVLDVITATARFTTELALTNRGATATKVDLVYTASLGAGSGRVTTELLPVGQQIVLPNVLAYLKAAGLAIPDPETSGAQGGTLLVQPQNPLVRVTATARTTTPTREPLPQGAAGLAYAGELPNGSATSGASVLYGLRATTADRSNVAIFNTGTVPVTLRVTAVSGEADRRRVVVSEEELGALAWKQFGDILREAGMSNGYVLVERTSSGGTFGTYAVINDNVTNDGSFVTPVSGAFNGSTLTLPVLVETGTFRSELVLTNRGSATATLRLSYRESLSPSGGAGGTVTVTLAPGQQRILPEAIDFLRTNGAAIGAAGAASYGGAVRIAVSGVPVGEVFAGARTAARTGTSAGGQFGLFTPAVYPGQEATSTALLSGLRTDANNRTNVAVLNAGADGAGTVELELQAYDGSRAGAPTGSPLRVTLAPGEWAQPGGFFAASGVQNGFVKVIRLSGTAPWYAYAVVNDGGNPGQRTGDGAYVAADTSLNDQR